MMDFINGEVLFLDKPLHWTSFQLVNKVKYAITKSRKIKKLKVGHAGTLDPLATGVMVVCIGKATKRIEEFQYQTKEYIATLQLGATTPSFDLEHEIDAHYPSQHITKELIECVLPAFIGEIMQIPPVYSAVRVQGKRAYDYARGGEEIQLQAKPLQIDEIEVLNFDEENKILKIRVVCSKGTYIRALARDIGKALDSGAHLIALQRSRIGNITLDKCLSVDGFLVKINSEHENIII